MVKISDLVRIQETPAGSDTGFSILMKAPSGVEYELMRILAVSCPNQTIEEARLEAERKMLIISQTMIYYQVMKEQAMKKQS